jgi:hypothetical protein
MVPDFICSQNEGRQPTSFWNFLALHSSQTVNMTLKDFVTLAERRPLSSPASNSLLQAMYGLCVNCITFLARSFFTLRYFSACFENSGEKYGL